MCVGVVRFYTQPMRQFSNFGQNLTVQLNEQGLSAPKSSLQYHILLTLRMCVDLDGLHCKKAKQCENLTNYLM